MKTTVSLPDKTFKEAKRMAKQLDLSLSELFTEALVAFLKQHKCRDITEKLNQVYTDNDGSLDPFWRNVRNVSLSNSDW